MAQSKYHPTFHPQLARWIVSYGYSDSELARELGVAANTVKRWKSRHPKFADAIREASKQHDQHVERRLLDSALGSDGLVTVEIVAGENEKGAYHREKKARIQPSLAAQKFWLQHRRPERWRDNDDADDVVYDGLEYLK